MLNSWWGCAAWFSKSYLVNPDPISDQKCHFSDSFSDIALKEFMPSFTLRLEQQQRKFFKSISISHISLFFLYSFGIETINKFIHAPSRFPRESYLIPSSETQGRSVGLWEEARRKFSSTGGKAPGYRLSPDHFQTVKRMLAPAWAQNCFVLLSRLRERHLLSSFRECVHDGCWLDHGLSGSCTEQMHEVRKRSVWYKLSISICCLPKN